MRSEQANANAIDLGERVRGVRVRGRIKRDAAPHPNPLPNLVSDIAGRVQPAMSETKLGRGDE